MWFKRQNKTIYVITIASVIVGFMLSLQWQAQSSNAPITRESSRERVNLSMQRLEEEQTRLKEQIADLRSELEQVQSTMGERKAAMRGASDELRQQKMAAGFVAMEGPGVIVKLNDSANTSVPQGEDPERYLIHEYDLRDVTNALWAAGAEAVSINNERFIGTTAIYCVGSTIMVNDARMSPPYEITAIGDPETLAQAMQNAGGLHNFRQRAKETNLGFEVQIADKLNVPAYSGSFDLRYSDAVR